MAISTIREAKKRLSRLIERAERGEEILIARGRQSVVRLTPLKRPAQRRHLGLFRGEFQVGPEFFEPLPPEELHPWQ